MLVLHTKDGTKCSNAILYGGDIAIIQDEPVHIYLVESDFGNRMRLTWKEIVARYNIGPVRDYREWRSDRDEVIARHDETRIPFEMCFMKPPLGNTP